jgi:hypothetical protein
MAIIERGILGGFSNKIGNVVGSSWKGIAIMKSLPLSVANPRTAAQVNQRNKFSGCVAFASSILGSTIKPLWDRFAQKQSGYNAFIQKNVSTFEDNGTLENSSAMVLGEGKLGFVAELSASEATTTDTIRCTINRVQGSAFDQATDQYYITVFNRATQKIIYSGESGQVGLESYEVLTTGWDIGNNIDVWINRRSLDGTQVGSTGYATFLAIL